MNRGQVRVGHRTVEVLRTDKVLFPHDGVTKGDLIDYYQTVAGHMVPHLKDRPLALERFPNGIEGERVFQQHRPRHFPDWIDTLPVKKVGGLGRVRHVLVADAAALVYLANQACITPHAWLSRADRLEHPDQMIFDLDPGEGGFAAARGAALALRDLLADLDLPALVKTTGVKGCTCMLRWTATTTSTRCESSPGPLLTCWPGATRSGTPPSSAGTGGMDGCSWM